MDDPQDVILLDISKDEDGNYKLMKHAEAEKYCKDLGEQLGLRVELPSGTAWKYD